MMKDIRDDRAPIAMVRAVVEMPLYEGDKWGGDENPGGWNWFIYEEPQVNASLSIVPVRRDCRLVEATTRRIEDG